MKTILKSKTLQLKASSGFTYKEILFLISMMTCGFCLAAEAAITKSVSTSFFVGAYDTSLFPYAWLCSLPLNLMIVYFYNRFIAKLGPNKMMGSALIATALFNIICAFQIKECFYLPFGLYIWKEVFVMFFFHSLWSVIHSSIDLTRAKYLYGLIFGIGGMGSIFGGFLCHRYAISLGSDTLMLLTVPLYVLTFLVYYSGVSLQPHLKSSQSISFKKENASFMYGFKLVKASSVLLCILTLVICMQMSSTITEYQFNIQVKQNFPLVDERCAFIGKVLGMINCVNIFIQFFGSYLLLRFFGLLSLHVLIPVLLLSNFCITQFFPSFSLMCFNYGAMKSIDYSLFGIITAMLYIPLSIEEKFQGKSFISILGYRGAKAITSMLMLLAQMVYLFSGLLVFSYALLLIFSIWIIFSIKLKSNSIYSNF